MFTLLSSRRHAFTMLSLLVAGASASAACTLDVSGREPSGAGGSMMVCSPGAMSACYGGPGETKDIGTCKSGMHTCNAEGTGFGACAAQVLPAKMDDCTEGKDESCDGELTCPCTPKETKACYDGLPVTTVGVGICKAGERTCNAGGTGFGVCVGEVKPAAEDCATDDDENCDNAVNEAMSGCVCDPKVVMPVACDAQQPGECGKGTKSCAADGKGYDACTPKMPSFEDCFTSEDEDCNGMPAVACLGGTILAGTLGTSMDDEVVFDVASDATGNIFLGGLYGSSDGSKYGVTTGSADITKLNNNGIQQWKRSYPATGGSSYSVVRGVAVDGVGSVIITGEYKGTIASGGVSLTSVGNAPDAFVIKLDAAGDLKWSKSFGGNGDQFAASISAAANGDVFIIGTMSGQMSFGATTLDVNGSSDVFVAKLEAATGNPVWSKNFGDSNFQYGWHVAATPDGNVAVTGQFDGNIDFGGGNLGSQGGRDIFLAKLEGSKGAHVWSKSFGDSSDQAGYGAAVDSKGNIVITGVLEGETDFGGGNVAMKAGKTDIFVARFGPDGTHMWSKRFGDDSDQVGGDIAVDAADNVLITGYFMGEIQFGSTPMTNLTENGGQWDVFVAKLKATDGSLGWARSFGDMNTQMPWAITADPLGNVIFGGTFKGTINFGLPAGSFTSMNSTYDAFWAKLKP